MKNFEKNFYQSMNTGHINRLKFVSHYALEIKDCEVKIRI